MGSSGFCFFASTFCFFASTFDLLLFCFRKIAFSLQKIAFLLFCFKKLFFCFFASKNCFSAFLASENCFFAILLQKNCFFASEKSRKAKVEAKKQFSEAKKQKSNFWKQKSRKTIFWMDFGCSGLVHKWSAWTRIYGISPMMLPSSPSYVQILPAIYYPLRKTMPWTSIVVVMTWLPPHLLLTSPSTRPCIILLHSATLSVKNPSFFLFLRSRIQYIFYLIHSTYNTGEVVTLRISAIIF